MFSDPAGRPRRSRVVLVLAVALTADDLGDGLLPADEGVVLVAVVDRLDVRVGVPDGHQFVVLGLRLRVPVTVVLHPSFAPVHLADPDRIGDVGPEFGDEAVEVPSPPRLHRNTSSVALLASELETSLTLLVRRCSWLPELQDFVVGAADGETEGNAVLLGIEAGADGRDHLQPGLEDDEDVAAAVQDLLDLLLARVQELGRDVVGGREHGQLAAFGDLRIEGSLVQNLGLPLAGGNHLEPVGDISGKTPKAPTVAASDDVDGPVCPLMGPEGSAGGLLDLLLVTAGDSGG